MSEPALPSDLADDRRVVLTLDAGGTNFVFSAIQGGVEVVEAVTLPSRAGDLEACLATIVRGFEAASAAAPCRPVALSFAFPGPADYPQGIIGDLYNMPAFTGGVALGPMLEDRFSLPAFINNDGDLFALGEAVAGLLPEINRRLAQAGRRKRYRNVLGATFGTGFGAGIVQDGRVLRGDTWGAAEIWLVRHKLERRACTEETVSIRGVRRAYAERAGIPFAGSPDPREIHDIALGQAPGDRAAAREAFRLFGEVAGDALATAVTLVDGLVVIGGGLAGAHELFLPALVAEMNGSFETTEGGRLPRLEMTAHNLADPADLAGFLGGESRELRVPGSMRRVVYEPVQRIGVGLTRLGTSRAVAVGAYVFALAALDGLG